MLSNHIRATHTGLRSAYETMFSVFSAVGAQLSFFYMASQAASVWSKGMRKLRLSGS